MLLNAIRAHLSEFGIVLPQGPARIIAFMKGLRESGHPDLPDGAALAVTVISSQLYELEVGIHAIERKPARLVTVAMANKTGRIAWALMAHGEEYRAA